MLNGLGGEAMGKQWGSDGEAVGLGVTFRTKAQRGRRRRDKPALHRGKT